MQATRLSVIRAICFLGLVTDGSNFRRGSDPVMGGRNRSAAGAAAASAWPRSGQVAGKQRIE